MSIKIDTLRFQNSSSFKRDLPFLAEAGISVDTIPEFDEDGMPIKPETDIPLGYYYVSINKSRTTFADLPYGTDEWNKTYSVSKDSIYDYLYGYNDEQETPIILERYNNIEAAAGSAFLSYFLFLEQLMIDSQIADSDYHAGPKEALKEDSISTSIVVKAVDDFSVISNVQVDGEHTLCLSITTENGYSIQKSEDELYVFPIKRFMIINKHGDCLASYPLLEFTGRTRRFNQFLQLEQLTHTRVKDYLKKEFTSPDCKYKQAQQKVLRQSLLTLCFGDESID